MADTQLLITENTKLKEKVILLQKENDFLREKFKLAQSCQFGTSSEKSPAQVDWLFNEAEVMADEAPAESDAEIIDDVKEADAESTAALFKKKTGANHYQKICRVKRA